MNQTDLPDLVSQDLSAMAEENRKLKKELELLCSHCQQLHENEFQELFTEIHELDNGYCANEQEESR